MGMTGLANLGLSGFFAVGAYTSAIAVKLGGTPIFFGIIAAIIVSAILGAIVSISTLRLRADYLAIVTFGFSEFVRLVASNEIWLTNGTDGIAGIPGPWRSDLSPQAFNVVCCTLILLALLAVFLLCARIGGAPYGRVLRAIRDDEHVVSSAGKHILRFKLHAFALGAGIMGLAGACYAHYTSYIAPDVFRTLISMYVFLALTAGGMGNNIGATLGAFALIALLESLRFAMSYYSDIGLIQVAALREMIVGLGMILILRFAPRGLIREQKVQYLNRDNHSAQWPQRSRSRPTVRLLTSRDRWTCRSQVNHFRHRSLHLPAVHPLSTEFKSTNTEFNQHQTEICGLRCANYVTTVAAVDPGELRIIKTYSRQRLEPEVFQPPNAPREIFCVKRAEIPRMWVSFVRAIDGQRRKPAKRRA